MSVSTVLRKLNHRGEPMQSKNIYQRLNQIVNDVETLQKAINQPIISPHELIKALYLQIAKGGVIIIPVVIDLKNNGLQSTVKVQISFVNVDNPSDKIQVQYFGYGKDSLDSGITKAITHAVNNALLKIFCCETFDSLEARHYALQSEDTAQTISQEQLEIILELAQKNPQKFERILELLQVRDVRKIQKINYEEIVASLQKEAFARK